jgi:hypothetical protein
MLRATFPLMAEGSHGFKGFERFPFSALFSSYLLAGGRVISFAK